MRISDWSADVCSSDLIPLARRQVETAGLVSRHLRFAHFLVRCAIQCGALLIDGQMEGAQKIPARDIEPGSGQLLLERRLLLLIHSPTSRKPRRVAQTRQRPSQE